MAQENGANSTIRCPNLYGEPGKMPRLGCRLGFNLQPTEEDGQVRYIIPQDCPLIQRSRRLLGPKAKVSCRNIVAPPSANDQLPVQLPKLIG